MADEHATATSWRAHRWPLLAYLILGALRLGQALSVNEAVALTRTELGFSEWLRFGYSPIYLLILDTWAAVSVHGMWLRGLGWGVGLIGLVVAPRMLRSFAGVHASAGAMWLICLSPYVVGAFVRVTPASLAFLLIVVSSLCFVEFLRAGGRGWLGGWVAVSLIAHLLHGGLYVLPLLQCLSLLVTRERTHARQRDWWLAQVLPLLGFVYLFRNPVERFVRQRLGQISSPTQAIEGLGQLGSDLAMPGAVATAMLLLFLVLSGLRTQQSSRRDPRRFLLLSSLLLPGAIWLLWLPYEFYALIAAPALACLVSTGIRSYPQWGRQVLWTAIFVLYAWGHFAVLR